MPSVPSFCSPTLTLSHMNLAMQLYNDNVWHAPGVEDWVKIEDKEQMRATPLTQEQIFSVEEFYFFAYVRWLGLHPLGDELASIPMMNTWDDHDIFDGYVSPAGSMLLAITSWHHGVRHALSAHHQGASVDDLLSPGSRLSGCVQVLIGQGLLVHWGEVKAEVCGV